MTLVEWLVRGRRLCGPRPWEVFRGTKSWRVFPAQRTEPGVKFGFVADAALADPFTCGLGRHTGTYLQLPQATACLQKTGS
jgi:hypothetical protein